MGERTGGETRVKGDLSLTLGKVKEKVRSDTKYSIEPA